jgi:hypothetical protein
MLLLACLLSHHLIRILVFPETEKHRLAQSIIPRPLLEFDLANNRRLDPATTFHFGDG